MIIPLIRRSMLALVTMAGAAGGELLESHNLSLSTVAAVGMVVFTGTWSLSKRFANIEDRLGSIEKTLATLETRPVNENVVEKTLAAITRRLEKETRHHDRTDRP